MQEAPLQTDAKVNSGKSDTGNWHKDSLMQRLATVFLVCLLDCNSKKQIFHLKAVVRRSIFVNKTIYLSYPAAVV